MTSTRLSPQEYLDHLDRDVHRLAAAWRLAPTAVVPTCPGWDATDLVRHVAAVYEHKVVALQVPDSRPASGSWPIDAPDGIAVDVWLLDAYARVSALLVGDPAQPCWTWWPPEQTLGFWQRRMAHETAVHAEDGERAAGTALADPDESLARDGIDELLGWTADPRPERPTTDGVGLRGLVRSAAGRDGHPHGTAWGLTLLSDHADVDGPHDLGHEALTGPAADADAVIGGSPIALWRWAWGRDDSGVRRLGDPAATAAVEYRVAAAAR